MKRTVTIPLEEYESLNQRANSMEDLKNRIEHSGTYTVCSFRDYSFRDLWHKPLALLDSRRYLTNEQATMAIVEDLEETNKEFKKLDIRFSDVCDELNKIKSKWWYKLFNYGK